jgi:uncharacterized lipoprotein YddW (UPF0748 family)
MRNFFCFVIFLSFCGLGNASEAGRRALWVVRDALKNKASLDRVLSDAQSGGFTDLFVQVRGRGDAYYRSQIVPRAEALDDTWDPLQYILSQRSTHRMRIHAWINVFYVWSAEQNPRSARHVFHARPEWVSVSKSNVSMLEEGTAKLIRRHVEGIFLSPANADVQNHVVAVVEELLFHYPLDGIHLDYIRYPGNDYDYSAAARSRFLLDYHVDPLTQSRDDRFNRRWADFCREQVSTTVQKIRSACDAVQGVELSAAVFPNLDVADNQIYQDWPFWVRQGWLDFAVIMNYAADDRVFSKQLNDARASMGMKSDRLMVGIAIYHQPTDGLRRKIKILKEGGIHNVALFSHAVLQAEPKYLNVWKSSFGKTPGR